MPFNDNSHISFNDKQAYNGKWVAFVSENTDILPLVSVIIASDHCLEICNQSQLVKNAIAEGKNVINEFITKAVTSALP